MEPNDSGLLLKILGGVGTLIVSVTGLVAGWFTYRNRQQEITKQAEAKAEEARLAAKTAEGVAENVAQQQENTHNEAVLTQVMARVTSLEAGQKEDRDRADRREEQLRKENDDCWQRHREISVQLAELRVQADMRAKERKEDSVALHRQVADLKTTIAAVIEPPKGE
jgi:hypothetical protein